MSKRLLWRTSPAPSNSKRRPKKSKERFLINIISSALVIHTKKPDTELMNDRIKELGSLASGLDRLQEALPELCAKTESPHAMVTRKTVGAVSVLVANTSSS